MLFGFSVLRLTTANCLLFVVDFVFFWFVLLLFGFVVFCLVLTLLGWFGLICCGLLDCLIWCLGLMGLFYWLFWFIDCLGCLIYCCNSMFDFVYSLLFFVVLCLWFY